MIHKKCQSSSRCETIIRYMFAASMKKEEQEKRVLIKFLGGNILAPSPYGAVNQFGIREVNTRKIEAEFNSKIALYKGTGSQLIEHHVLSLPRQDTLTDRQFSNAVKDFLQALGADASTTWVAAKHEDTEHSHVHIALCRVQAMTHSGEFSHYGLMNNKNDHERAIDAVREIEKKYDLTEITSPGEDFNAKNQAAILRAIGKAVLAESPMTMADFVLQMASRGVCMKAEINSSGKVHGLTYRLNCEDGRWISGSKIMATKFTFGSLKSLLDYSPQRDDRLLGVGNSAQAVLVESFQRSTRVKKMAVVIRSNQTQSNKEMFLSRYPQLRVFPIRGVASIGFIVHINLLTSKKSAESMDWAVWEELVRTVTQGAFKMLEKSFSPAVFECLDLGANYRECIPTQILEISRLSPSTIDTILDRLHTYLGSDEFLPNLKEITLSREDTCPSKPNVVPSDPVQLHNSW